MVLEIFEDHHRTCSGDKPNTPPTLGITKNFKSYLQAFHSFFSSSMGVLGRGGQRCKHRLTISEPPKVNKMAQEKGAGGLGSREGRRILGRVEKLKKKAKTRQNSQI